jgi:hypothetical protein
MEIYNLNIKSEDKLELFEQECNSSHSVESESDRRWARCRHCRGKIALNAHRIQINQTDNYIFQNPSGIFFRVICFSTAPGAANITEYTEENTWFKGFAWSISLCRHCGSHIGWHYVSADQNFYGLVADRLYGV